MRTVMWHSLLEMVELAGLIVGLVYIIFRLLLITSEAEEKYDESRVPRERQTPAEGETL